MNPLIQRILEARFKVVFRRLGRNVIGQFTAPDLIEIDLRARISPVKIYIHECIHRFYPDWSETRVVAEENMIWRKTSRYSRFLLYRKLFNRKFRTAEDEQ